VTTKTLPLSILAGLYALVALFTPTAAAEPTTLDALPRGSGLDAGKAAIVWSRYDESVKAYRLVVRRGAVNTLPLVDPSPIPFDADVGSDAQGRPAVVYSRCASYRHDRDWRDRCDLYILSLATGAERKVGSASRAASESGPSLWRGELAWIADRKAAGPAVYHRSLTAPASRSSERVPVTADAGWELELSGDRLAAIVGHETAGGGDSTEVRLVRLRSGSARRIAFQNIGENNQTYIGLSFAERKLAWFRGCFENPGCAGSGAYRFALSNRRYDRALEPRLYAGWAWTGNAVYTAQLSRYHQDCRVDGSSPPSPCLVSRDVDPEWKRVAAGNVR